MADERFICYTMEVCRKGEYNEYKYNGAGRTMNDNKVKNLVITAFFTAITFLGIQSFRIPLPAAVGTPFLHFGHIFVVMGLLLQGGKRGAVSGTLGLTILIC